MSYKILIVDDEPHILKIVSSRLTANGYTVITASNGDEGLSKCRDEHPDLMIIDVMMPAPNGISVCTLLKSSPAFAHLPIILLTAKTNAKDIAIAMDCGANDYIIKPYNAEELLNKIHNLLQ